MVIAAEFFRISIGLVVALCVGIGVAALGYHVRTLRRKVEALEDMLEDVGSTDYLRWALDQTNEDLKIASTEDGAPPRRHLWLVPAVVGGWLADRLSRQPLATAVAAATTAVVASIATAPHMDGGGKPWSPPPAAAEAPPSSAPLELTQGRGSAGAVSSTTSTSSTTTTTTTTTTREENAPSSAGLSATTTTTVASIPTVETTLPTLPSTTLPPLDKPGKGPPIDLCDTLPNACELAGS